jgi:hypothetical protein
MTYWFKSAAVFLALLGVADVAFAAVGEVLATINLPPFAVGFSIAADCSGRLYSTIRNIPTLYVSDKDGTLIESFPTVDATTGNSLVFIEMAWDKGRGKLWAGVDIENAPVQVYLLDPTTGEATFQFTADFTNNFPDGLAYDGTDDTVWVSPSLTTDIYHYQADGLFINKITPTFSDGTPLTISGVVVGVGDLLYVGRRNGTFIFKVKKSDGSFISSLPSLGDPDIRNVGLACDVKSFAPFTVIWSRDRRFGRARAIEVDAGTCTCDAADPGRNGGAQGDPHFTTWLGGRFDYHGECDLVLLQSSTFESGLGLDVQIRTQIRRGMSFISSAALRIGTDVLEVSSQGVYYLNGVAGANLPAEFSGFPFSHTKPTDKQHVFDVHLGGRERIKIKTFKDFVSVLIEQGRSKHFGDCVGLMGDFEMGQMIARDGETVLDNVNEYGQEWQVLGSEPSFFQAARFPQHPQVCTMPAPMTVSQLRRRLSESTVEELAAEKACAHWVEGKDDCVFDVLVTGDLDMAVVGAY